MKAKAIITLSGVRIIAGRKQFFQKSENGKSWYLWDETTGLLRFVKSWRTKEIAWVIP